MIVLTAASGRLSKIYDNYTVGEQLGTVGDSLERSLVFHCYNISVTPIAMIAENTAADVILR